MIHDKLARLPTKDQNGTTSRPFFLGGKKRIAPGPSPSPEQGCTAPGDAFCIPPGAPHSHSAPAALSNSDRQVHQLVGRAVDGKVQMPCCPFERRQDGRHLRVDPRPTQAPCHRQVASGDSVRHVGFRRDCAEVRKPIRQGRRRPKGRQDAIDGRVLAVTLGEGPLAGDVVDERQPPRREATTQRHQRQDLRQDFQHVYERLPRREGFEEGRRCARNDDRAARRPIDRRVSDAAAASCALAYTGWSAALPTAPAGLAGKPVSSSHMACLLEKQPTNNKRRRRWHHRRRKEHEVAGCFNTTAKVQTAGETRRLARPAESRR